MLWHKPDISSYPYCPAVRAMASENTPLVVKSDEEFPTRRAISFCVTNLTVKGMGTDKYTLLAAWQNFTSAPVKKEVEV